MCPAARTRPAPVTAKPCPCGRPLAYAGCCGRYHAGEPAPDAESLMRSRYCAYVLRLEGYLLATWHADTRPTTLELAAEPQPKWLRLEIAAHKESGATATVEFVARCKIGGRAQCIREISRFVRIEARWFYVDGVID